jgi:ABC-type dipeptide/oligopeptide/nickel transport system permease subunit
MQQFSFSKEIWDRFKKNKGGLFGLVVIITAVLVTIFGYIIAPDDTPNADMQTIEIQAKKPGYTQEFLKVAADNPQPVTLIHRLVSGKPASFQYIPIKRFTISGDLLTVQKYVDDDTAVAQVYSINQLTRNAPDNLLKDNIVRKKYWLGTDKFGRDILSRLIIGTRVSLAVGLIAVIISLLLGISLGLLAGYYRGWIDAIISWFINVTWSIPTLLLVFAITLTFGKGLLQIFVAVGLTLWINIARLVRGQVIAIKQLEYVQAAKALGIKDAGIMWRHILPNIFGPIMVLAASNFATAIIIEAGLSFLGIGIQPPQPSWGLMIKENYNFIITHNPMLALIPGFAIMLLVLAFNLLGNGLRDALDVRGE